MAAKKDTISLVEDKANKLLALMGAKAKAEVLEDKENEAVRINIKSDEETGLLIGRRGETIEAIQVVLGLMIKKITGDPSFVVYRIKVQDPVWKINIVIYRM